VTHKINKVEFDERKAALDELKKPKKPKGNINSVPALRDRVYLLEKYLGIEEEV